MKTRRMPPTLLLLPWFMTLAVSGDRDDVAADFDFHGAVDVDFHSLIQTAQYQDRGSKASHKAEHLSQQTNSLMASSAGDVAAASSVAAHGWWPVLAGVEADVAWENSLAAA